MRGTYGLATPFGLNLPRARSREQSCNERAELVANEGEFRYHRSPLWYASDGVIRSIYRWEDRVHDQTEARVALHTRRALVSVIVGRADRHHPYAVPCVIAVPIVDGNPAYINWVLRETANGIAAE
jgi:hypothetical protein